MRSQRIRSASGAPRGSKVRGVMGGVARMGAVAGTAALALAVAGGAAGADVVPVPATAVLGEPSTVALHVTTDCGAAKTDRLLVIFPEGILPTVTPPRGWTAARTSDGVELKGSPIPAPFTFTIKVTVEVGEAGDRLYFPVIQSCGAEEMRWTAEPDGSGGVPPAPAPWLALEVPGVPPPPPDPNLPPPPTLPPTTLVATTLAPTTGATSTTTAGVTSPTATAAPTSGGTPATITLIPPGQKESPEGNGWLVAAVVASVLVLLGAVGATIWAWRRRQEAVGGPGPGGAPRTRPGG